MSLAAIIGIIIAFVSAVLGAFLGNARGKSVGKKEGAAQAKSEVILEQSQNAAQAAKERTDVEIAVAADSDDDLDRRLSKHDRPS